jgi:hypothetical protein
MVELITMQQCWNLGTGVRDKARRAQTYNSAPMLTAQSPKVLLKQSII